jgi:RNA polymerase primary sigma factor
MYGDLIEDVNSETPDESTLTRLRAKELANALSQLNPRMRYVLALRFGLDGETPQTLEEVGVGLGIRRARVRQLEPPHLTRVAHSSTRPRAISARRIKRPAQSATEGGS